MEQPYEQPPVNTGKTLALASLIVGIVVLLLSCIPFAGILTGIMPIVLGTMALRRLSKDDSARTLAIIGILLGSLTILFGIGWGVWAVVLMRGTHHLPGGGFDYTPPRTL